MTDGEDVRQLERNLRALGYDPGDVDDDWDWETTDAVQQFQLDRDLDDDGKLSRGEVVFRPGETRIGEAKASVGDSVSPGRPVASLSSTERVVTVAAGREPPAGGASRRSRHRRPSLRPHRQRPHRRGRQGRDQAGARRSRSR